MSVGAERIGAGAELPERAELSDPAELAHCGLCLQPSRRRAEQRGRFVSAESRVAVATKTQPASLSLFSLSQCVFAADDLESDRVMDSERISFLIRDRIDSHLDRAIH